MQELPEERRWNVPLDQLSSDEFVDQLDTLYAMPSGIRERQGLEPRYQELLSEAQRSE